MVGLLDLWNITFNTQTILCIRQIKCNKKGGKKMDLDYIDISTIIERIVNDANEEGFKIMTVSGLHDFLERNEGCTVKIIG